MIVLNFNIVVFLSRSGIIVLSHIAGITQFASSG